MKVTIEENEYSKYIFDTDELPHGVLRRMIEKKSNEMIEQFECALSLNIDDIVTTIEFIGVNNEQ